MRLLAATIAILSIAEFGVGQGMATETTYMRHHHRPIARHSYGALSAESHVGQVPGSLRGSSESGKLPPEGAALGATPAPRSLGQRDRERHRDEHPFFRSNSTSTECYTATQQARPLAK